MRISIPLPRKIVFKIAETVRYRGLVLGSSLRNLNHEWDLVPAYERWVQSLLWWQSQEESACTLEFGRPYDPKHGVLQISECHTRETEYAEPSWVLHYKASWRDQRPFSIEMPHPKKGGTRSKPGKSPKDCSTFQGTGQERAYYQTTTNEHLSCPSPLPNLPSPYWGQSSNC